MTNTIKSPGSLTLGADLDNLSVGIYQITGVKINVSGTTVTVWGTIIVCRRAFDYQQVILSNGTKAIYYRSKNESEAWTEWKQLITNSDLRFTKSILEWSSYSNGTYQLQRSIFEIPIIIMVGEHGRLSAFWASSQIGDNRSIMIPEGMITVHIDSATQITLSGTTSNWTLRCILTI